MDTVIDFTKKFQIQFIDAETFTLKPESEFRQLGSWDSLTGMAVLVMIKDNYGVDIPVDNFREMKTVYDVYSFILSSKRV
jgi:acyl carrier protein